MKIAILANCQGGSIASSAKAMNPQVEFEFVLVTDLENGQRDLQTILRDYDKIFAQKFIQEQVKHEFREKVFYFPSIAFPAFHPDMTYVRGRKKDGELETILNMMFSYHSAIAVFGYITGISASQIVGFYNPHVFSTLGYFDMYSSAREDLINEGSSVGMPLGALLNKWTNQGCFMHTFNHPHLRVLADITRDLLLRAGVPAVNQNVADYLEDPLKGMPIWPVYPAIAERFGLFGDYAFKPYGLHAPMSLVEYVESCYNIYDKYETISIEPLNFSVAEYQKRLGFAAAAEKPVVPKISNPYAGVRPEQFWKNSVTNVVVDELDPVLSTSFKIAKTDKVATAGSCFAQHISRTLSDSGFNYFVAEDKPTGMSDQAAKDLNFGVFSARFGNIYTVRQLLQLLKRTLGIFKPNDISWVRGDGRLVDPFRPQIEPDGFVDSPSLQASSDAHLKAVKEMFTEMDVFVFTLGLTEGWRSKHDGAMFPLAPGVAGGEMDFSRYEFVNFSVSEICADLYEFFDLLSVLNSKCRSILTVSPVPLIATYETKHALVATTYSKSALRAAAEHAAQSFKQVEYFPSFEIITGSYNRGAYFEPDLRSVTSQGVAHVMRVFMSHYAEGAESLNTKPTATPLNNENKVARMPSLFDIVCDEEAIAKF
jgi:GSCFA family/Polysaccharide biosynthesis enzyme WcbI